jgi:hypothetical protein
VKHCSDEDLILRFYGEDDVEVGRHVLECPECAAAYSDLAETLKMIPVDEVPAPGPRYGLRVWQQVRHVVTEAESPWRVLWKEWNRVGVTGLAAALLVAGFIAGRSWRDADRVSPSGDETHASDTQRRILLTVVAEHFDRSGRVLTDIMNASDGDDISAEQQWAADLLATSRLYRQDAEAAGERSVAAVLDELERALLEIVHSPARATRADLEQMRRRIDAASLLFKVRVLSGELEERGRSSRPWTSGPPLATRSRTS